MLDWPLAIHTSPTRTFLSVIVFLPTTRSSSGPPAFNFLRRTIHCPFFAVVEAFWPRNSTVTFSPSSAQPHTGTAPARCRTISSENNP
jgi:hypothetical protein